MSELQRYTLGRPRPPFEPRTIQCTSCGAPQQVADERAVQLVCSACGARLELHGVEAAILSGGRGAAQRFPLALDAPFTWKGHRYRVTARLALTEDGDPSELTRLYYLYSPRRSPLILDEYKGVWTLSWDVHVQPLSDPLACEAGDRLQTGDGRSWACTDEGEYTVSWVDGALPWIQQAGDRIRYAEFRALDGSPDLFDAERQGGEVEVAHGRTLSPEELRQATGDPKLQASAPPKVSALVRGTDRWPLGALLALSVMGVLFNGVLYISQIQSGEVVLSQTLQPYELEGEALTNAFRVPEDGTAVAVHFDASSLANAWMAIDFALVGASETVIHVDDVDLEYYYGVEDGESWSEGSRDERALFLVPTRGDYQLLLHAVDAPGETEVSNSASVPLHVKVRTDARPTLWAMMGAVGCGLTAIFLLIAMKARKGWDDDDDD